VTALDILLRSGPLPATDVARALGAPLADVYAFLVHAEAQGQVEIRCPHRDNQSIGRVWAPTPGNAAQEKV
jgi:DNA-binding IclR family transcriptional regulator